MNNIRDKELLRKFGSHLISVRKSRGISQKDLAYIMEVEISQVYRIEKGIINPTLSTLKLIANSLNLELNELLVF